MQRQIHPLVFSLALLLFLAVNKVWCAGDGSRSQSQDETQAYKSFIRKYRFRDPYSTMYMKTKHFKLLTEVANMGLDANYYRKQGIWEKIRKTGADMLSSGYPVASPTSFRQHPQYAQYVDGQSSTPTLFLKVADVLPDNPLKNQNPDVAIFMHSVLVTHQTKAHYQMNLKYILRGPSLPASQYGPEAKIQSEQVVPSDGSVWLKDMPEPFKWPVLPDLERLGYSPSTIEREIIAHDRARDPSIYSDMDTSGLSAFLRSGRSYLGQFDKLANDLPFNEYELMTSSIDGPENPITWFQVPLLRSYRDRGQVVEWEEYSVGGTNMIALDKIKYQAYRNEEARTTLMVPEAIVRPVSVVPALEFRMVYNIPPEVRNKFSYELRSFLVSTYRKFPDRYFSVEPRQILDPSVMFSKPRPKGHPFESGVPQQVDRTEAALRAFNEKSASASTLGNYARSGKDVFTGFRYDPPPQSFTKADGQTQWRYVPIEALYPPVPHRALIASGSQPESSQRGISSSSSISHSSSLLSHEAAPSSMLMDMDHETRQASDHPYFASPVTGSPGNNQQSEQSVLDQNYNLRPRPRKSRYRGAVNKATQRVSDNIFRRPKRPKYGQSSRTDIVEDLKDQLFRPVLDDVRHVE